MLRVKHELWGDGIVLSEKRSDSGFPVATVIFDADPQTERTILTTFLEPSTKRLQKSVAKKKKVAPKPKSETISDQLLVGPDAEKAAL